MKNNAGLEFKKLFEQLGLKNVHIDKVGNVIGTRPGEKARPNRGAGGPFGYSLP